LIYLWIVSLLWSASFGLISQHLQGVPASWSALVRLGLALLVFLPFLRPGGLGARRWVQLAGIGAVQYGLMYVLYFAAFPFLPGRSYLLALFTVTTPLFVVLFDDWFQRRWSARAWLPLVLAVGGAALIQWPWGETTAGNGAFWPAFLLLQGSNAAFALGQIGYREVKRGLPAHRDRDLFAIVLAGAVLMALGTVAWEGHWTPARSLGWPSLAVLFFLGTVSSGLGFFWWNKGATLVSAEFLAVMNNVKIPLAVAVSLLVFGEWASLRPVPFVIGSAVLAAAVVVAHRRPRPPVRSPAMDRAQ
jgi:drug/metabolite transporter (DMT)-like permease